jgi:signal transduction histidine kinase
MAARTGLERRALQLLARVVSDSPFRAPELIDRVCAGTRDAFGLERVEWNAERLVAVPAEGKPPPNKADLSVLNALGEAAAAVADRARDVDHANRLKTDFVSIASHELRTPISVVHGIAATLQARAGELEEEQTAALLATLVQQTARLRDLADQLLDLSRIGADGMPLHPEGFSPHERIEELLPRFAADRLDDVCIVADPALVLVTDPVAFERVVANLILNALRYGKPPVEVRVEADEDVRVVVEDSGAGVAPEFVPHLFERFSRSDETRRAGAPGSGLGLAIARAYADAMGGSLSYAPAQPHGARFTLSLPAARS